MNLSEMFSTVVGAGVIVCIVSKLQAEYLRSRGLIHHVEKDFSLKNIQKGSGMHPLLYSVDTRDHFPRSRVASVWSHLHVVLR
jgi:hypothetical protein